MTASLSVSAHPAKKKRIAALSATIGTAVMLVAATTAHAEPSRALDRFSISGGVFNADPTLRFSTNTNFGRLDSGEVERQRLNLARVKADVLLFDSQGLSFDYFRFRRDYGGSFASNFNTGSGTVSTSGAASLNTQVDFAKVAYKWWLGSGDTVLGLGAGAAYYRVRFAANATATVGGGTGAISDSYTDDAYAPLLEVGVRHQLTDTVRLFADASGIARTSNSLKGSIYNAALGVEWFPLKNVGFVLDYGITDIDLTRNNASNAQLKIRLKGPSAFVKVRF